MDVIYVAVEGYLLNASSLLNTVIIVLRDVVSPCISATLSCRMSKTRLRVRFVQKALFNHVRVMFEPFTPDTGHLNRPPSSTAAVATAGVV